MTAFVLAAALIASAACGSDDAGDDAGGSATPTATDAGGGDTAPTVVKIGVPLDLTGPAAVSNIGLNELAGAQLAADEIERTGFLEGFELEIVSVDTKADKAEAVAGVLRLVEQDGVDAIVGFTLTPSFLAAAPQAIEAGIPIIAAGLAAPGVTEVGETVFRIIPNVVGLYTANDAIMAEALGITNAAYVYVSDSETTVAIHNARQAALEAAGVETAIVQEIATEATDFRTQLTSIAGSGADGLVVTAFPGQFAGFFLQAEELGLDLPVISSDGSGRSEVLDQAAGAMQCVVYNSIWAEQSEDGRSPVFAALVRDELDGEPDLYYAAGYDGIWAYATALRDAGSSDTDAIVSALNSMQDFQGAFGTYDFADNREPTLSGVNLQISDGEVVLWTPESECEVS